MDSQKKRNLHVFFLPFLAHGHLLPTIDIARLFSSRGVRSTIVTTPLNLPLVSKIIAKSKPPSNSDIINTLPIRFPSLEAGLPEACENVDSIPSTSLLPNFFKATGMLQQPFEQILRRHTPDCLIAAAFFPWATDSASRLGIPRIVFHGTSAFSLCAAECVSLYQPHRSVSSESEPFVIPHLPGEIKLTRLVLPDHVLNEDDGSEMAKHRREVRESAGRSFGVIVNSFYGLELIYARLYQKLIGRKTWHIGPVSLFNKDDEEKANRGKQASVHQHDCLKWLDSKKPSSVVYVCFGSIANFTHSQLREIAMALEASPQNFIWVVRRTTDKATQEEDDEEDDGEAWLPEGFEKRIEGRGMIIRGWAPQVLILDHEATGGFVTHCGWNSTAEAVSAGVPMVTWPVGAEQFYNEKLVTQVLRIGVSVGAKKWVRVVGDYVGKQAIVKAVKEIMEGEDAEEMRTRAKRLAAMAMEAMNEGGSSSSDLDSLIQQLSSPP